MKIALPVKKQKDKYVLSPAFGKAKFFIIVDTDSNNEKVIENIHLNGKGIAEQLATEHVEAVITNHIGEGAFRHLKKFNIEVYFSQEKNIPVEEVLKLFEDNKLPKITSENFNMVPQHEHHHHH